VCWFIHRVATSQRYCSGLREIQLEWSLDDLMDAVEVLDMFDVLADMSATAAAGHERL
jgi:hypothetical protein